MRLFLNEKCVFGAFLQERQMHCSFLPLA
jgi:hypothetical protein